MASDIGIRVVVLGIGEARRNVGAIDSDLKNLGSTIQKVTGTTSTLGQNLLRIGSSLTGLGRTLTLSVTTPLLALEGALIKSGITFEDAFAGVSKTVDGVAYGFKQLAVEMYGTSSGLTEAQKNAVFANDKFGELTDVGEDLRASFRKLATEIPISAAELAKVGQTAGQLGVPRSQLEEFTKTMALLGVATDLSAEQASFAIARFANIMGVADTDLAAFAKRMGSSIVALGNTAAATESEITNLALRLAGAGRQAGLSEQEILGLAASLAEIGVRAELGGTAMSRVLLEIINSISEGGETLQKFADIAGQSAEQFAATFKKDPVIALQIFLERLAQLQDSGDVTNDTMRELGLSAIRVRDVMARLGPNMDLVRKNIDTANTAWEEQIALQEEAQKRFKTIQAQLTLLKNRFIDLGITIFDLVKDDITFLISAVSKLIDGFKNLDPAVQGMVVRVGLLVAALGPALIAFGTLLQLSGNATIGLKALTGGFKLFGLNLGKFSLSKIFKNIFGKAGSFSSKISSLISSVLATPFKGLTLIFSGVGTAFQKLLVSPVTKGFKFIGNSFKNFYSFLGNSFGLIVSMFTGPVGSAVATPFKLLGSGINKVFSVLGGLVGFIGGKAISIFKGFGSTLGWLGGKVAGLVPLFGNFLFKGVLGFVTKIPLILGVLAGAFTLIFAPKVISQAVKNWDKLLAALKESAQNFTKDLKNEGLEKALLKFSYGGMIRIATALGASAEHAERFGYALGTASYWLIRIAKSTAGLVTDLLTGAKSADILGSATKSTSDRIIGLAAGLAKFLEGFFTGWISTFEDIKTAFGGFTEAIKGAIDSLSTLFGSIFGKAKSESEEFRAALEPLVQNTASRIGATVGQALGQMVVLFVQGLTILVQIAGKVADALNTIVTAYKVGGVKGVFEELGPILAGIFNGFIEIASTLWDTVKPYFVSFVTSAGNWLVTDGVDLLKAGASSIAKVLSTAFLGTPEQTTKKAFFELFNKQGQLMKTLNPEEFKNAMKMNPEWFKEFETRYVLKEETTPAVPGLLAAIKAAIQQVYDYLTSEEVKEKLRSGFNTAMDKVSELLNGLWNGTDEWEGLKVKFTALGDSIKAWAETDGKEALKSAGTAMGNALIEGLKGVVDTTVVTVGNKEVSLGDVFKFVLKTNPITGPFTQAIDGALEANKKLAEASPNAVGDAMIPEANRKVLESTMESIGTASGESMSYGMGEGVKNKQALAILAASRLAISTTASVNRLLGISSPSTVFTSIGENLVLGLINGINAKYPILVGIVGMVNDLFSRMAYHIINQTNIAQDRINYLTSLAAQSTALMSKIMADVSSAMAALTRLNDSYRSAAWTNPYGSMSNPTTYNNTTYNNNTTNNNLNGRQTDADSMINALKKALEDAARKARL